MIGCDICNRQVELVMLLGPTHNAVRYCDLCWYNKNPPILILTKLWGSPHFDNNNDFDLNNLYSPKIGRNVFFVKGQMEKCGFALFNKKIFFDKEANEKYREVLVFKYSGHVRCLALREYRSWPLYMKRCSKVGCQLY